MNQAKRLDLVREAALHPIYNWNLHPNLASAYQMVLESDCTTEEKINHLFTIANVMALNTAFIEERE